jgi:hypothetical protein
VCDTLCVRTGTGMLFGKNSDRPVDEAQVVEWCVGRAAGRSLATQYLTIDDTGAAALVGSRPTWLRGLEHGVNEHGVAIGNEKVWTVDDPREQAVGLLGMDLVRLGLERARTADAALEVMTALLAEHGQGGSGELDHDQPYFSSFLVTDPHGGWLLETSARTWAARPIGSGASISNRLALGADWARASADVAPGTAFDTRRDPRIPTHIADHRLAATRAFVERSGAHTPTDVVAALRDHGHGPWGAPGSRAGRVDPPPKEPGADGRGITVCMHVGELQTTTASMVVALDAGAAPRAWACLGNPCVSVYVPVFLGACAPELADAAQWSRFAELRRRVEHDAGALAAVRAEMGPVEAELWHDADAAWTTGAPEALAAFAARAWAPVDAALARLGV